MTDSGDTQSKKTESSEVKKDANATSAAAKAQRADNKNKKPEKKSGRGALILALLALLIALLSAGAVAAMWYFGQMRLSSVGERVTTVERGLESNVQDVVLPRVQKLAAAQSNLQRSSENQHEKLKQLSSELTQSRVQLGELTDKVEGGLRRWKLLEIQGLLLTANERLLLNKDVEGAQQALELASDRLAALNDPRLFKVREQIVNELAALNALPKPDFEGMTLTLNNLIQQVPKLPLAKTVPSEFAMGTNKKEGGSDDAPWRHFLDSAGQALSNMVTIRRDKTAYKPLMPPEQKFFLVQNLQLKLQSARLSLLQRESQGFSQSLDEAGEWLRTFFDKNDPAVAGALKTVSQLKKVELAWDNPDISGSVESLKTYLEGKTTAKKAAATEPRQQANEQPAEQSPNQGDPQEVAAPENAQTGEAAAAAGDE